jgi:hypothetical protein
MSKQITKYQQAEPITFMINCEADFRIAKFNTISPKLKMIITELINNKNFELAYGNDAMTEMYGPHIKSKLQFIKLIAGNLYPGNPYGYDVTIEGSSAYFIIPVTIEDTSSQIESEYYDAVLKFIGTIPNRVMLNYQNEINRCNGTTQQINLAIDYSNSIK